MGSNKTASTSFQSLCTNSRKVLIENSLVFPQFSTWRQHSFAAWMSQKRDVKSLSTFLQSIFTEAKDKKCESTLISGEDFENFLVDTHLANEFEELAKLVGYKDIEWIFIQREPLEYLLSIYSEMSAYKGVLDLELISNIILEYGFVSISANCYNWKFVFDINKFSKYFKKNVNHNLKVIKFEDFISDFVGAIVFKSYINEISLAKLKHEATNIGIERKRHAPEKIEFRYVANFLGMKANRDFHEKNKELVDSLVNHRLNRNEILLPEIDIKFKERFG